MEERALVGYRRWMPGLGQDHELWSVVRGGARWRPGTGALAHCGESGSGPLPSMGLRGRANGCGLYAHYELLPDLTRAPGLLVGAVVAWGRLVEHDRGFRAERARIVGLLDLGDYATCPWTWLGPRVSTEKLAACAEHYDVPVLSRPELVAYAGWYGEQRHRSDIAWEDVTTFRQRGLTGPLE